MTVRTKGAGLAAGALVVAVAANLVSYRAHAPVEDVAIVTSDDSAVPPAAPGNTALSWADLGATRRDVHGRPVFLPSVRSLQGRRVEVSGFAFQLRSGLEGTRVVRFALMPPSLSGCCGPTCTPSPERTILVACAGAPAELWTQPGLYARVTGDLSLAEPDSLGCYYTIRATSCRFYDMIDDRRAKLVLELPLARQEPR